ncbi:hypothetical protein Trydic_g20305, partial [Trypoxylus dichotomus]
ISVSCHIILKWISGKMPIDRSISNVGIEYQYRVNTYAAACLSEDEDVEDYEIRTNLEGLPGFDDLVARVKYKSKRHYCVYMCQIKYSDNDYNFNYGKRYYLLDYKNFMDTILKTKDNYSYLHDVPDENLCKQTDMADEIRVRNRNIKALFINLHYITETRYRNKCGIGASLEYYYSEA